MYADLLLRGIKECGRALRTEDEVDVAGVGRELGGQRAVAGRGGRDGGECAADVDLRAGHGLVAQEVAPE